jgi:hypothetical protein
MRWRSTFIHSVGEQVKGHFWGSGSNLKEGLREFDTTIAPGTYVVKWPNVWLSRPPLDDKSVERQLAAGEATITVPKNGNWAVTIPVTQSQISYFNGGESISLTLKNAAGTPLEMAYLKDVATVFNAQGEKTRLAMFRESGASVGDYIIGTGGQEDYVPGVYTVKIEKKGYVTKTVTYTLPDVGSWSDADIIAKHPGVIDLGTVVLEKE